MRSLTSVRILILPSSRFYWSERRGKAKLAEVLGDWSGTESTRKTRVLNWSHMITKGRKEEAFKWKFQMEIEKLNPFLPSSSLPLLKFYFYSQRRFNANGNPGNTNPTITLKLGFYALPSHCAIWMESGSNYSRASQTPRLSIQ